MQVHPDLDTESTQPSCCPTTVPQAASCTSPHPSSCRQWDSWAVSVTFSVKKSPGQQIFITKCLVNAVPRHSCLRPKAWTLHVEFPVSVPRQQWCHLAGVWPVEGCAPEAHGKARGLAGGQGRHQRPCADPPAAESQAGSSPSHSSLVECC